MTPDEQDRAAVQEALGLLANNQTIEAYAYLENHIIANRYAHQSRETYAKLLLNQGELLAANNLISGGLALAPNHRGFKKVRARILLQSNQIAEAIQLLLTRAPSVAEDIEYHEILASAQLAGRDFEGAALSYRGLVQQNLTEGKYWYGFAAAQDMLGNHKAAQQAYGRAMQQASLSANLRRRSQERLTMLGSR
jgi:MSHA biogenesis protein MshN